MMSMSDCCDILNMIGLNLTHNGIIIIIIIILLLMMYVYVHVHGVNGLLYQVKEER